MARHRERAWGLLAGVLVVVCVCVAPAASDATAQDQPVPHSLLTDHPGRPILPLWGWETTPFYQRANDHVASTTEILSRAVDESFRRGANLVEIYRGGYPSETRSDWTLESTRHLHREIHGRDMLVHWFPHRLAAFTAEGSRVVFHGALSAATGDQTFDGAVRMVQQFAEIYDALDLPPEDLPDGLGTEQWPEMHARLFDLVVWPYNPALYFYTDNHMFTETLPNEMDVSASNGFGSDDQTTGYYQLHDEIHKQGGLQFWGSQAECRTGMIPGNTFGGRGHPDWIVKQVDDQFRVRARTRGERLVSPSALWWINEAENMCPDENRAYVYGVSQDPIRGAVAAQLTMLGEGGLSPGGRGLAQRFPYPATSTFIQNNYLRVMILPDGKLELLHDPERLAQYDSTSHAARLSPSLLSAELPVIDTTTEILEPAGYLSVVRTRLEMEAGAQRFVETRTLTMQSDSPWVHIRVERSHGAHDANVRGTRIALPGYDRLVVVDSTFTQTLHTLLPAIPLVLRDSRCVHPDLAVVVVRRGMLHSLSWSPNGALALINNFTEDVPFEIAIVLFDGLYREDQLPELQRFLATHRDAHTLPEEGGVVVANTFNIPVVDVVRVKSKQRGPYQVHEFGRWMHRGAQPSTLHPGEDYVKVYLPAHGRAEIQDYGFIGGVVRPGWGCQYTTAILDCTRQASRCAVDVEVNDITSFLFAPRLRFADPIARAWLDGKPWSYFDGDELFLPNRQGRYHVEIEPGKATEPHLARTFADISQATSTSDSLSFTARLPEWTDSVPEGFHFTALIRHPGREIRGLTNARRVRGWKDASVIQFVTGTVSARFEGKMAFTIVLPHREVEAYLDGLSADMLRPCLTPFRVVDVTYDLMRLDKTAADECDVLVWNRYFQDEPPQRWSWSLGQPPPPVGLEFLSRVEAGKGILLLCNAVSILLDVSATPVYYGHRAPVQAVGLAPRVPGHPVFAGLPGGRATFITRRSFEVYKWLKMPHDMKTGDRRVLADLAIDWTGDAKDRPIDGVPALWEETRGNGKILACTVGLSYGLGGLPRHPPGDEATRLIQNAIRYLAGKDAPVVGLVHLSATRPIQDDAKIQDYLRRQAK